MKDSWLNCPTNYLAQWTKQIKQVKADHLKISESWQKREASTMFYRGKVGVHEVESERHWAFQEQNWKPEE